MFEPDAVVNAGAEGERPGLAALAAMSSPADPEASGPSSPVKEQTTSRCRPGRSRPVLDLNQLTGGEGRDRFETQYLADRLQDHLSGSSRSPH